MDFTGGGSGKNQGESEDISGLKWVTLFDSMNKKAAADEKAAGDGPPAKKKSGKRLSVERIYQKKTQLEHILLRPDTYIGSVEPLTQNMWVFDADIGDNGGLCYREITFVPGLYKIFDEILVNAADNKQRDAKMDCIKITIDSDNNLISVWNNGKGIPVVVHQTEKVFVPTLIFGHLLTSSNYNDEERKVTGGRNGYGAKLCNIFSTKFTVTTAATEYHKQFKQVWKNNMSKASEPAIKSFEGKDFTEVSFQPDLSKFKMEKLDKDTVALLTRRAYDIAGINKGVKVYLNGKRLPVRTFKEYVDLYVKGKTDENDEPLKVVHEVCNDRWEVCITLSEKGFNQVSFANSIATTKGGRHVDYVVDRIVEKVMDVVKKKNKGGINIRPFQIKNHIWVFVNCLIENPTFDSQTKENMTLQVKKFGSVCKMSDKFIKQTLSCGIVESIMNWVKFKAQTQLNRKCSAAKHSKLRGIPKLDDANDAGTKNSKDCTLILTEGDSAKTLAVSGLSVVGRDKYGVFPLRGKLLNVREATHKQIMENAEINNVIKIMGLQYKKSYESDDALKTLRYGKLMIMTDQDQDGSHIKGLLVNFIHHNWPSLLKHKFLEEFITPIVKVSKGKEGRTFYSLPEFEEWQKETPNHHTWRTKYYKGLGTSTGKEAKEYFGDMARHRIPFKYTGPQDDAAITLAFSKKKTDERKEWLTDWLSERKKRRADGLSDLYLYNKDTRYISYNEFVNKELVLFSNMDNERSIPSMVDGLKPGQRKVLFTCFKRNDKREVKVAQLAGSVAEHSAYHHGEASLMGTIINLAQNFVGSNNVNLLQPVGQFGTRLHGGKDAASPRYIFTMLSPLARLLMPASDDASLNTLYDDNQRIEPEWYCPIIPMVLVNGAEGIGTGWSTKVCNFDVREVVANIKRMIDGEEPRPMLPSYKGFKGGIEEIETNRYACSGEIAIVDNDTLEITELPVRVWTQAYKESVLEPMLHGSEKVQPIITDYKEYHTDTTVKIVVKMSEDKLLKAEEQGLHKVFKLQNTISQTNNVLFDQHGCIKKYDDEMEILTEFFELRLDRYRIRKEYLEGLLAAESNRLDNQARFIMEKIENKIVIENKSKRDLISMLVQRGYDSDPIKAWKESKSKDNNEDEDSDADSMYSSATGGGPDFNYLLGMALWSLSKERKDELLKNRDAKAAELDIIRGKTPADLWTEDLDAFSEKLEEVEAQERADELMVPGAAAAKQKGKRKKFVQQETRPSPMGRRVVPRIDPGLKKGDVGKGRGRVKKVKTEDGKSETKISIDETSQESSQPLSLAERLAKKGKPSTLGASKPAKKQSTLAFKPAAKKKSKKNPWESESDGSSDSDLDSDMDFQPVVPRETTSKRTAAKKVAKYTISDDDDEEPRFADEDKTAAAVPNGAASDDSFHVPSDSDSGDSFGPEPVQKKYSFDTSGSEGEDVPVKPKQPSESKKPPSVVELDSDSSVPAEKPKAKAKAAPAKKKTLGKKTVAVGAKKDAKSQPSIVAAMSKQKTTKRKKESDSEDSDSYKPKKKAASKKKVIALDSDSDMDIAPAPSRKIASDSDSDSEEFIPKKVVKKVVKKAAAPKAKAKSAPKKKSPKWDDTDDEYNSPEKSKVKAKKGKKVDVSYTIDDDSDDGFDIPPPRERTGRAKASSVKYNFGDDDDDSDY